MSTNTNAEHELVARETQTTVTHTYTNYPGGVYTHEELDLDADQLKGMYENMLLQRRFEERAAQMYGKQKIAGFLHLYIGQEAVSTGAATAMKLGLDTVITAYRDHGLGLALGMTADECMAELFGKQGGSSKGKGGSMHYFDKEKGMFGGHGIVGAHIPVGGGIAFAHKYKGDGGACLTFFGDGAVGQGAMHEAFNLAASHGLPVVFIVENNAYAMGTAVERVFANPDFHRIASAYNMTGSVADGMDVLTVTKAMRDHLALARSGQASVLELKTYRYRGHSMSDPQKYRTKEELDGKKEQDPILRLKAYMLEHNLADLDFFDTTDAKVKAEVLASVEFAENSPFPALEEIYDDVYTQKDYPFIA